MFAFLPIQFLICVSALYPESWVAALRYDRLEILNGQWWRIFAAPFVHLTFLHAIGNLLGASFVWFLFGKRMPGGPMRFFFLANLVMTAVLFWGFPTTTWYCGFSGLTYAALVGAGLYLLRGGHGFVGSGILVATALKIWWERGPGAGASPWDFPVAYDTHLAGGLSGVIVLVPFLWSKTRIRASRS